MPEPALRFLLLGMDLTKEDEDLLEKIHAAWIGLRAVAKVTCRCRRAL